LLRLIISELQQVESMPAQDQDAQTDCQEGEDRQN